MTYSRSYILLFLANIACACLIVFSRGVETEAQSVDLTRSVELEQFESVERVITYDTLKPAYCISASKEDIENLMRIVQAEAGGEDRKGKLLVANVVINRVKNAKFPNNITDVIFQKKKNVTQFSPVSNGAIYNVKISEDTKDAVYSALYGEDVSEGALFFMARQYANPENEAWFDNNLTYLFSYGGHDFFKR
ncbi:MAG: cell wall hydrolase [Lachnospiraceae bacterium]|nr:cell wall hydrolase [Lachnospiraceae bacterium]